MPFGLVAFVIIGFYLLSSIKILREYERGVIFRLGRMLAQPKGPGIILVFWPLDTIMRISLQQEALEVPPQDTITRDNVTLKVNAVITLTICTGLRTANPSSPARSTTGGDCEPLASGRSCDARPFGSVFAVKS